jgi:cysteine-rich repeat protein
LSACGDEVVDEGEECDDGNEVAGDGCDACTLDCGCPGCMAGAPCTGCSADLTLVGYKDAASKQCYLFNPTAVSWDAARASCMTWGGDLAALSTAAEMSTITGSGIITTFQTGDVNARCWNGGNDGGNEGVYQWSNGEPWQGAPAGPSWNAGDPNGGIAQNCFAFGPDGTLHDRVCTDAVPFLCERSP